MPFGRKLLGTWYFVYKKTIMFLPNRSIRTLSSVCWISIYPVAVEIYMFVDKDQYTRKSELLLEHVIYSTSASVDVALSVRAEDLSRE